MPQTKILIEIGARIKAIRKEKKLTQSDLANLCDFEKATMSRIESGQTNVTIFTLFKISNALNIHISELFKNW